MLLSQRITGPTLRAMSVHESVARVGDGGSVLTGFSVSLKRSSLVNRICGADTADWPGALPLQSATIASAPSVQTLPTAFYFWGSAPPSCSPCSNALRSSRTVSGKCAADAAIPFVGLSGGRFVRCKKNCDCDRTAKRSEERGGRPLMKRASPLSLHCSGHLLPRRSHRTSHRAAASASLRGDVDRLCPMSGEGRIKACVKAHASCRPAALTL
jgi:hypothetical protein